MTLSLILLADENCESIHFTFFELAYVNVSVCKLKFPLSILFSVFVMTLILSAIGPLGLSLALDAALHKLPSVGLFTLFEIILTLPVKEAVNELALVI